MLRRAWVRDRHIKTNPSRKINVQAPVTPPCASSVQEKQYTIKIDEPLFGAMLFLSDYRFTAASATYSHCSVWILTELVPSIPAAHPIELECTPNVSKVTLSPDHSSSGREHMLQHREAAALYGRAEPFPQRGGVFLGPEEFAELALQLSSPGY